VNIIFSFVPVLLFLITLYLVDSFKLVRIKTLLICFIWGILSAIIAYFGNTWISGSITLEFRDYSRYLAPVLEETLKASVVVYLISRQKVGFTVDAIIYGFASGAGFAIAENMVYIVRLSGEPGMIIWMLRGLGTALMHGGCSALLAMSVIGSIQNGEKLYTGFLKGFLIVYVIHSGFNHFFLNPYLQTLMIFTLLPLIFAYFFQKSNLMLQNWLEIEFSSEAEMLSMIRQGKFSDTKAGGYLVSLKKHFKPEMIVDLYCYISLYLELSLKAKRNLMLKENGFPAPAEADIDEKLEELFKLRKVIGKVGELAVQPLVRMKHRELWKLNQLRN
jgi:protease PrsW